jgi:hypothetical protein
MHSDLVKRFFIGRDNLPVLHGRVDAGGATVNAMHTPSDAAGLTASESLRERWAVKRQAVKTQPADSEGFELPCSEIAADGVS